MSESIPSSIRPDAKYEVNQLRRKINIEKGICTGVILRCRYDKAKNSYKYEIRIAEFISFPEGVESFGKQDPYISGDTVWVSEDEIVS